jgi:hypothetical protein
MDNKPRVVHLENGIRVLNTEAAAELLLAYGLPAEALAALSTRPEVEQEKDGNALDVFANRVTNGFLGGNLPFWEADALLNHVMRVMDRKAPQHFWKAFVAFEDCETQADPDKTAAEYIKKALGRDAR